MTTDLTSLPAPVLAALAKGIADAAKDNRENLAVGTHTVSETITLTVSGTVTVGEDYPQRIVLKADPFLLLAVALSHLNDKTIDSIVREALTADAALAKSVKKQAEAAWEAINAPTVTACKGKVTHKGTEVALVSDVVALAAK